MICPICTSDKIVIESKFRNKDECFSNIERVSCENCKLHFAYPMPSLSNLNLYNNSYHKSAHGGHKRNFKQSAFFSGIAKTRLNFIRSNMELDKKTPYKILEIGPGPGAFVGVWRDQFINSEYYVIETDKSCHSSLYNLGVRIVNDKVLKEKNLEFNFIIMSHVLEHVTTPKEFLKSYLKYLKKGGHIFIEVPCMDWKHKKLDEPHLLFFDKPSMSLLMDKLNLTKVSIGYFGIPLKSLINPIKKFKKRLRNFLWRKGISFYHPEKKNLLRIGLSNLEAGEIVNFESHIEHSKPSWWLRVLFKK
tara:strand:- start:726 stop:1637 length:912 start_codon:yes stop_codon:yes gene_type:complete